VTADPEVVVWHDLECGGYGADLPLWRELAADADGAVLDLGAGTGRVALDLARRGYDVVALDRDAELLAALEARAHAADLDVATVCADARAFQVDRSFALCLVPMQTIQVLGGAEERGRCLACVRAHLVAGGRLAAALADPLEGFSGDVVSLPLPDMGEHDGWVFSSQPVALHREGGATVIERHRQRVAPDGARVEATDLVRLDHLEAAQLEGEAGAHGLRALPRRRVAATEEHVGSDVVLLEAT
jgi:SAM-dependent methyltransferase